MIGTMVNHRYMIENLIAEGGMAHVYKALDTKTNQTVALKILKSQFSGDKDFIDRFLQEAMAVAKLNHKNIVKLYDYGSDQGLHYLSLEYVDGYSLDQVIKKKQQLSVTEAVNIAVQVCEALDHAHQQKIIHRDIKPHNILIDYAGRIKVTDFGIAKAISSATITHAGGMLGSVQYFSPEQAKGERATESSDIYSLGVVLYEMLTGVLPFSGETHFSIALKHVQERPVHPRKHNPGIPDNVELIILKALSKKSEYRFAGIQEMKMALLDHQNIVGLDHEEINGNLEETKVSNTFISQKGLFRKKTKPIPKKIIMVLTAMVLLSVVWAFLQFQEKLVPDVVGLTESEAVAVLEDHGFQFQFDGDVFSDEFDPGIIVSQIPASGEEARPGSYIYVKISGGDRYIIVPDIVGSNIDQAKQILAEQPMLIGNIEEIYHDTFTENEVIYQEPGRGTMVPENSLIDVVVSLGPKPIDFPTPRVIGISQSSAEEIIRRFNLLVGEVTFIESFDYSQGTVVSQQPLPNALIRENQTISLLVSSGPGPRKYTRAIPINMEEDGVLKIVVNDIQGESVFLQERREKGFFSVEVEYFEEGQISVFLNENKINEVRVP